MKKKFHMSTEAILGIILLLMLAGGIYADYKGLTAHPQWSVPGFHLIKDK